MSIYALTGLINGLGAIIFGLLVYKQNRKSFLHQIFGILNLAVALWGFSYFFWLISDSYNQAYFWVGSLSLGANFIPILYLHWILTLLKLNKKKRVVIRAGYILTVIFSLFIYTSLYIEKLRPILGFAFWPKAGPLYILYILILYLGLSGYGVIQLFKLYNISTGKRRSQLQYIILGSIIGFSCAFVNFPLWYDIPINPFLNIGVIFYIGMFTYAMVRHRLMDIKLVLRKYSVYTTSLISIILPALVIKYIVNIYFAHTEVWVDFIILIVAISVFSPIKNYYYRIANKYFFSSLYDSGEVIAGLSDKLRSTLEVKKIYHYISDTLIKSFHAKAFAVITPDEERDSHIIQYNNGFKTGNRKRFPGNKYLRKHFIKKNKSIIVEELKRTPSRKYNKTIEILSSLGAEILTPMNIKDKTVGLIVLGAKESGDMYNDEDLGVLRVIGAQAAIAIQNALLYEETRNFGMKLEKEVAMATAELRAANKRLKKLDQTKSEFISIASHQLRTPLTIIKGYISMMLEGNFGKLTPSEVDSLDKVYKSNERLIQLVENLLNISRIESGRLQFHYEVMQLKRVVDSVVEELASSAKKNGLRFIYKKPSEPLPKVKIDEEKIRQVVLNLIDNAIKYTKKGSITVGLRQVEKNIEFCVADSGMGIREEDLESLFKKFFRGVGTSLVHTEGVGLGLYVARTMIEAHKGKIWAESKGENQGSRFCFVVPIERSA